MGGANGLWIIFSVQMVPDSNPYLSSTIDLSSHWELLEIDYENSSMSKDNVYYNVFDHDFGPPL